MNWPIVGAALIGICMGFVGGLTFAYLVTMSAVGRDNEPRYDYVPLELPQPGLRIVK